MESPTYILNEDTQPVIRAIGVSHTACKDEFRQNLRPHSSWSFFIFIPLNIESVWVVSHQFVPFSPAEWKLSSLAAFKSRVVLFGFIVCADGIYVVLLSGRYFTLGTSSPVHKIWWTYTAQPRLSYAVLTARPLQLAVHTAGWSASEIG